ncbi:MAG TPA: glucose-1-phosphate cytidylyltransferase [Gemmatimonadaceae bacterium]|nr:glucose-1-phosphate cytidylyltransferase [Gemmatimonadaceae bacterium]
MKTVILAGGRGTRLSEETVLRPKPMVEIGGKPLLWHIMHIYADHGFKDFLVACGYKGELIKEYFRNVFLHNNDYVIDLRDGALSVLNGGSIDWKVGVIDTGLETQTGGRIKRLRQWVGDSTFMVTYGDGVGDIDIRKLVQFHCTHGRLATVTAVRPPARFGSLLLENDTVSEFSEKPQVGEGWINGGFFVLEPRVFDYLDGDQSILEREPLERLAADRQLMAYRHEGFWQPMDTLREKELLESLWSSGRAPWKKSK